MAAARAVSDDPVSRPPSLDDPELDALEAVLAADVAVGAREALARAVEARVSPSASADEVMRRSPGAVRRAASTGTSIRRRVHRRARRVLRASENVLAISTENFARELKELRKFFAGTEVEDDDSRAAGRLRKLR